VAIASGGTLAAGNSIGTLTVDGDLAFAAGSRLAVEVNPKTGESDLVEVTGSAALNGGSVAHVGASGNYDLRSTYTILSADGALVGKFDGVTSDFAFLTPDLLYDYDLGTVDLELLRNGRDFASVAQTRNQAATAKAIEGIGFDAGHAVYDAIAQMADDGDRIRASFDQLSGEIHASAKSALIEESRVVRDAATNRIRAAFDGVAAPAVPVLAYGPGGPALSAADKAQGLAAWGHAFGSWSSLDGNRNAAGLDSSTGGLLFGADTAAFDNWRLGLLAGYSHTTFDADDSASSGSSDNYHLGLLAGTQWGQIGFRSGVAYSWHRVETSRSVFFPGFSDSLKGDYDAGTFQAFGELGYRIDTATASFEPFANLGYVNLHAGGFKEDGGSAALDAPGQSADTTFTTLGLRASTDLAVVGMQVKGRGAIGWRHAFGDTTPLSTHAFTGSDAFTVAGAPIATDAAVIEAGLDLNLTDTTKFGLAYQGQFGGGVQNSGFNAEVQVRF
jgi:outer membrane autotransporter protein